MTPAAARRRVRYLGGAVLVLSLGCAYGAPSLLVALGRAENWVRTGRASDPVCWYRQRTGRPCLGCGGTRAMRLAVRGDWRGAVRANPLGAWAVAVTWLTALAAGVAVYTGDGTRLWQAAGIAAATLLPALGGTCVGWWRALPSSALGP